MSKLVIGHYLGASSGSLAQWRRQSGCASLIFCPPSNAPNCLNIMCRGIVQA